METGTEMDAKFRAPCQLNARGKLVKTGLHCALDKSYLARTYVPSRGTPAYTSGQKGGGSGGSASNSAEAAAVARVVAQLEGAAVPRHSIGVICFFRAQVQPLITQACT